MNREGVLKLAIEAAENRIEGLIHLEDPKTCVLCVEFRKTTCKNVDTCKGCLAENSDYTCSDYVQDLNAISRFLREQIIKWEKELKEIDA